MDSKSEPNRFAMENGTFQGDSPIEIGGKPSQTARLPEGKRKEFLGKKAMAHVNPPIE